MDNLKTNGVVIKLLQIPFGKLKSLEIKYCEKLLTIVPSYMLKEFQSLEILTDIYSNSELLPRGKYYRMPEAEKTGCGGLPQIGATRNGIFRFSRN
ncbi:hypothetical protein O6P43_025865 [Quillaja saponaria]|uniref:Disease resistance protein At4g27190-like leucine-rich repeats domain-containing protein n=1 Tax=Quillaja saponaria TaxID=32244 RepID=A0AAD7PG34_QUISA|nr:hypothetical protein O6P43_025865 [Quillaja saponaria]